ncbi:MAG: SagB/ThcOx family dehydrogenase [Candidatus Heimdallarchaeota archaeon]|nr:SagB/ThcOx family dehydrogenase [Candidatus Heimdallarchaeota archaeon]MCK4877529.1 SagB/ThcOx family dehydrogenase [Candidatus Heimdallarchaeota archaeon]
MEKTKYEHVSTSDQRTGLPQPPLELEYAHKMRSFELPKPQELNIKDYSLRKAIEERKSVRTYSDDQLTLEDLSWLLWCTQGVKEVRQESATLRTVPSAGARHAFETFLLVNNVESLAPGIYRYAALEHKLVEYVFEEGIADKIVEAAYNQKMVKNDAVTFIWVAVPYRMCWRYVERGYRYLHIDAGHVCQNLYLAAGNINAGVCAIGAFHDDQFNELMRLDGEEEFVIYLASVGKKK